MPAPLANADLLSDPRRAGARAHFQAMGLDRRDLSKPLVGIATTWTGTMPCNLGQRDLAKHVAAGVRAAGGTPMEFNTIAVSDNQTQGMPTMRASLVSREVIADSIELVATSQPFDGLICIVGCDKTVPAAVMAMVRLDVPGLILCSGAMAVGSHRGKPVTIQNVWEAVGAHEAGQLSDEELAELERDACPGIGSCTGHFTASTMAVAVDFLGLGPVGLGGITATDPAKPAAAERAGRLILDVIARGARPSQFVTAAGIRNAIVGVAGTGGSTNSVLHLLAIADEAGVPLELEDFDRLSASTPVVTSLTPGGRFVAGDLQRVGGTAAVMKQLQAHLDTDAPTVDGRTIGEHAAAAAEPDGEVIAPSATPFKPGGALRVLRGNLAPDGAVVKLAGHERPVHRGPARVFESEAECKAAVYDGVVQPGEVVVVRGEGPAGRARHARDALDHLGDRRPRPRRLGRPGHGRAVQRGNPRVDGRARVARGGPRRTDRPRSRRRHRDDRCRCAPPRSRPLGRRARAAAGRVARSRAARAPGCARQVRAQRRLGVEGRCDEMSAATE